MPARASSEGRAIRQVELLSNKLLTTAFEASLGCELINNSIDLDIAYAINSSIELLHDRGYRVVSPAEASALGVGASDSAEALSKKGFNLADEKRSFSVIYNDFLDCETLKSKQKLILLLLMHYGGIGSKDSKEFPTASTLASKAGMSVRTVRYVIEKLLDYKLIVKSVRYDRSGRQRVVYDSPEIWQSPMWQTTLEPVHSKSTACQTSVSDE